MSTAARLDDIQQALIVSLDTLRALSPQTAPGNYARAAAVQAIYEAIDRLGDARSAEQLAEAGYG